MKDGMSAGVHEGPPGRPHNVPVITTADLVRLTDMVEYLTRSGQVPVRSLLDFKRRLACCKVVPFSAIGAERITMRSRVEVQNLESGVIETFVLVYPKEADSSPENVSVLTSLGTAMLGSQKGDVLICETEKGLQRYRVLRILYQPEAAGDYHL